MAKRIDKERDENKYKTQQAQERLSTLKGSASSIEQLQELSNATSSEDLKARDQIVKDLRDQIFSGEGEIYKLLNKHLKNIDKNGRTANELLSDYNTASNEEKIQIAKELKIAEKEAELDQYFDAQSESIYNQDQDIAQQYKDYIGFNTSGN